MALLKELSFCHKLKFLILISLPLGGLNLLHFKQIFWSNIIQSLKYQVFKTSGCKDIGVGTNSILLFRFIGCEDFLMKFHVKLKKNISLEQVRPPLFILTWNSVHVRNRISKMADLYPKYCRIAALYKADWSNQFGRVEFLQYRLRVLILNFLR